MIKSQRRNGETWALKVRRGDAAWVLVRESDQTVAGPFATMRAAEDHIAQNGGGYLDWGRSASIIPPRPVGQIALFHMLNGIGLLDWRHCEAHPRMSPSCHTVAP